MNYPLFLQCLQPVCLYWHWHVNLFKLLYLKNRRNKTRSFLNTSSLSSQASGTRSICLMSLFPHSVWLLPTLLSRSCYCQHHRWQPRPLVNLVKWLSLISWAVVVSAEQWRQEFEPLDLSAALSLLAIPSVLCCKSSSNYSCQTP